MRYCKTTHCLNQAAENRLECNKCKTRKWRERNPLKFTFIQHKANAKYRDISCSLTFDDWREFCEATNYLNLRGREAGSYVVDRIRFWEGYHKNNIQLLTFSQNAIKGNKEKKQKLARYRFLTKQEAGTPF